MKIRSNRSYRSFSTNQFQTSPLKQTFENQTKKIKSQNESQVKELENVYTFKQQSQVDRIEIVEKKIFCLVIVYGKFCKKYLK